MTNNSFRKNIKPFLYFKCIPKIKSHIPVYENLYYIVSFNGYYLAIKTNDRNFETISPNMALTAIITSKTISKKQFLDMVKDMYQYLQFLNV